MMFVNLSIYREKRSNSSLLFQASLICTSANASVFERATEMRERERERKETCKRGFDVN
jgi:hypothetical protein